MKIAKNFLFLCVISLSFFYMAVSCKKDDAGVVLVGNWLEDSDYDGDARADAVAFSIGNIGYVGTGYNGDDLLKDFYAYDADRDAWKEIAPFPGVPRIGAVAFTIAGKGYVGTGYDGVNKLSDFWAYDPLSDTWESVKSFEGTARYGAVAFSINGIGYVGTGYDGSNQKDFWAYDPIADDWIQKTSFQSKVKDAVGFVLNNKGYICTGYHNEYNSDFYMYDPEGDTWTAKRKTADVSDESFDDKYNSILRQRAVAFVVGTNAYITTGDVNNSPRSDVWEYNAATDLWTAKSNFEGVPRRDAVAFTTEDGRGFVTTGLSSTTYFDDIWEFKPMDESNLDD